MGTRNSFVYPIPPLRFTLHSGQMGTVAGHKHNMGNHAFTLHSGQMGTRPVKQRFPG